jgi:hypothetical protein
MKNLIQNTPFGKLPLEIWQFLACKLVDGEWVVLEEPYYYKDFEFHLFDKISEFDKLKCEEYQEAKERRFFDGFTTGFRIDEYKVFNINNRIFDENKTIENLLEYEELTIILTPTALQKIRNSKNRIK